MTHYQDEGHYQAEMNARAEAEMEAMMHQAEGEAMAELGKQEPQDGSIDFEGQIIADAPETELKKAYTTLELTFGEMLVGLTFNPSGDEKVNRAKRLCAELADLLKDDSECREKSPLYNTLFEHTIGEILNAQMNVVKVLTLKY